MERANVKTWEQTTPAAIWAAMAATLGSFPVSGWCSTARMWRAQVKKGKQATIAATAAAMAATLGSLNVSG
eukprot:scaffold83131_cov22-Tisochrysis_lutea.AAC.4